jgi:signal transduction histidine kinase
VDKSDVKKSNRINEINEMLDLDYLQERIPESIDRASNGIARVAEIIQAMKSFTRSESKQKALADINQAIESTLLVASSEYKYNAQVDKDFGEIPQIFCYISDLSQVLLNMIVNSAHAIEERFGNTPADIVGKIALTTRKVDNDIVITIWDNGSGIPAHVIEKIYDPFFTTKDVGKGTGQGLALCHRIICDGHNGKIDVSSADNEGTQFEITLPILETPDTAGACNESTESISS